METARLIVRRFADSDLADVARLIRDKMASPYSIYDEQSPTDDEGLAAVFRYFTSSDELFAVELKATGLVIGFVSLNGCGTDARNLGYCIHTRHQRKGYATEAVERLIRFARDDLGLAKLVAGTARENVPSVRLLSRMGFRKQGESVASFRKDESGNPIEFVGCSFELSL